MTNWLGMPTNASTHGAEIDQLVNYMHVFMAVLFVGWSIFFIYTLVRYRAGRNPKADYVGAKSHVSSYLEAGVVLIEAVLLIGWALPIWAAKVHDFPPADEALEIRVVAEQFAWNIHYAGPDGVFGRTAPEHIDKALNPVGLDPTDSFGRDDITTINQLHVPVHQPVIIKLTSKDVIHCFSLLQMRVKQDIIPGMMIPVWFEATMTTPEDERWEIACAQLCGLGHYRMRGFFEIHTRDSYDAWMAGQVADMMEEWDYDYDEPEPESDPEADGAEAETSHG